MLKSNINITACLAEKQSREYLLRALVEPAWACMYLACARLDVLKASVLPSTATVNGLSITTTTTQQKRGVQRVDRLV
jgi:hypothetical protein